MRDSAVTIGVIQAIGFDRISSRIKKDWECEALSIPQLEKPRGIVRANNPE